ncbi:hypothetical protein AAEU33_20365 [Chryseobacterium sp. Chry.R1]|uniref:hypothetical protein n=1 Tax=Chryseobacterium sp. Chry.R1 TaxID=3139392 RepID=UPI0031F89227
MKNFKKITIIVLTLGLIFSLLQAQSRDYKVEELNIKNFHLVDFIGWNNNMKVLAYYHSKDVKVFGDGWSTIGMEQHRESLAPMLEQYKDYKIGQHSPNVARGVWTGVVGVNYPDRNKMATIAKWKDGLITEEYLFLVQLTNDKALKINPSENAIINFSNPKDEILANTLDIQPGWSCIMEIVDGKRTAIFIRNENGSETERLVFQ